MRITKSTQIARGTFCQSPQSMREDKCFCNIGTYTHIMFANNYSSHATELKFTKKHIDRANKSKHILPMS